MKAIQITELLRLRHPSPDWATFSELADGTGMSFGGRIDFYAMHLWPSKKYLKIAYEIKVSRGDFMRELDNPRKRESAEKYADECYFAAPGNLLHPDEMPDGWGLIEADRGGLKVKKRARQKEVKDLPLSFVAALARRSTEPSSPLPDVFWRYLGEELSLDQLIQASKKELGDYDFIKKREAVSEFKKSDEYIRLCEIAHVVEKEISWKALYNPSIVVEWFEKNRSAKTDKRTLEFLERLQKDLNNILQSA